MTSGPCTHTRDCRGGTEKWDGTNPVISLGDVQLQLGGWLSHWTRLYLQFSPASHCPCIDGACVPSNFSWADDWTRLYLQYSPVPSVWRVVHQAICLMYSMLQEYLKLSSLQSCSSSKHLPTWPPINRSLSSGALVQTCSCFAGNPRPHSSCTRQAFWDCLRSFHCHSLVILLSTNSAKILSVYSTIRMLPSPYLS